MTIINFRCRKCKSEFDSEVGKIIFPENIEEKLSFEKDIACKNCGIVSVNDLELTELGQTQVTEIHLGGKPMVRGYGIYEGMFDDSSEIFDSESSNDNTLVPDKIITKFDASIPRYMYWSDKLKNSNQCPKCKSVLEKEMHSFFVIMDDDYEKNPFVARVHGNFCDNCPVVVLEKKEFDAFSYYSKGNSFGIHVAGIVDLDAIPENQRKTPSSDIDPLPVVQFTNYPKWESNDKSVKDGFVLKEKENGLDSSGSKICKEPLDFDPEEYSISELCEEEGTGIDAINDNNREAFYPLLLGIEETIWANYNANSSLEDSGIIESLRRIQNNIFHEYGKFNELERGIVNKIKRVLFLNNYAKKDVMLSISSILESVKLHRARERKRGYLNFISGFFNELEKNDDKKKRVARKKSVSQNIKIGRNELCPCGSGKKYKKCCLEL